MSDLNVYKINFRKMGNHLVGIAPSQIYPVEHYLMGSFESDLQYESR